MKPYVLFAQRCHFSFAVFLYVGREECSTKDRLSGVVGDAVNSTWAQSAMVHNLCFCWVHDGLLAVSSATCVPHCLACLPVAALYLPALHCSSAAVNSLDRSLRRLRCVKGFYLSNCYKFLCRDGLRSPCDRFSCLVQEYILYGWRKLRWLSVWLSPHEIHLIVLEGSDRVLRVHCRFPIHN